MAPANFKLVFDRCYEQMRELAIETDEDTRVATKDAQQALLNDWHLEFCQRLSIAAPGTLDRSTHKARPQHRSLDAHPHTTRYGSGCRAQVRAREVRVKTWIRDGPANRPAAPTRPYGRQAESERGQRLHVDKAMLRTSREDFARLMSQDIERT
jgi:hypothetical protein